MNRNLAIVGLLLREFSINHHQVSLIGGEARFTMHLAYDVLLCPATDEHFVVYAESPPQPRGYANTESTTPRPSKLFSSSVVVEIMTGN